MLRHLLWPLSLLFYILISLRNLFFDWGLFKQKKVQRPVLCIGNISTGGTGKTPWVHLLSQYFTSKNKKVTILSRGYSGDFDGVLQVDDSMDPRRCGDEPLWLKRNTKASVFVGRNRLGAAQKALELENPDLFILDDGFQHRKLDRDLNLVLVDASVAHRHHLLLPVGYLRETFAALKRANIVIINKCNYAEAKEITWIKDKCLKYVDESYIFYADFVFDHWQPLVQGLNRDMNLSSVSMSCGVGNPKAFLKTIAEQKIGPVKEFIYPDHYYWKPADIEKMTYQMNSSDCKDLVITEKDAVKLNRYQKHFLEMGMQLWVCKMKVSIKNREKEFFTQIQKVMGEGL